MTVLPPTPELRIKEERRFLRVRRGWRRVGVLGVVVLVLGYLVSVYSFGQSVDTQVPDIQPPQSGVRVEFVPERVNPSDQSVAGRILLYPAADLVDSEERLLTGIVVDLNPAIDGGTLAYPAGRQPEPENVLLPAPGVVQEYPWDSYAVAVRVSAAEVAADEVLRPIPSEVSIYFRMPSWRMTDSPADTRQGTWGHNLQATISRAGSTRSIAVVLLTLMVILAAIAVGLVVTTARGRHDWEFVHATWMTSMLFALMPLRSSFPGDPPLGVWIDILVFFWVEVAIMACVAVTAFALVIRASEPHPELQDAAMGLEADDEEPEEGRS